MGDARAVAVQRAIEEEEIPKEIERFEEAKVAARRELRRVAEGTHAFGAPLRGADPAAGDRAEFDANAPVRAAGDRAEFDANAPVRAAGDRAEFDANAFSGGDPGAILEAYVAMLNDPELDDRVRRHIAVDRQNAEAAVCTASDAITKLFSAAKDAYIQERRHDVAFVCDLVLRALVQKEPERGALASTATIVLARDLSPADTAGVVRERALGFSTERGSRTSHTAIMARALEMPAVLGVEGLLRAVTTGDMVVVDGFRGEVILHPSASTLAAAEARLFAHHAFLRTLRETNGGDAGTADGVRIELLANVELAAEARVAEGHGAEGIGLFRTEFLYIDRSTPPTEDEQFAIYRETILAMNGKPVVLRTFDIGGDKFASSFEVPPELNPALGLRAVRLALSRPEVLLVQLRAMARASAFGDLRILVPMVSQVAEMKKVRELLAQAVAEIRARGEATADTIPLGMMIEVPSAAILADVFARHADFFSLGTNDLVQYLLAVDRTNTELAPLASPYDPAALRLIASVTREANSAGIPLSICGAMASDLHALPLLVGLGLRKLSMEPATIRTVKAALRRLDADTCRALVTRALHAESATEVRAMVHEATESLLSDLLALCAAT
jgi:phosphotransferase system enzyme I (PtsI)